MNCGPTRRLGLAAAVAFALAGFALAPTGATAKSSTRAATRAPQRTVRVTSGRLRGKVSQGVREFLGVPYAAPPVYNLRFAPPQPVRSWRGVRSATTQGPACIQFQFSGIRNTTSVNEDCLYLDIYTPANARPGQKLPVLFWMHGGAHTQGTGVIYGGQRFATLTHSIFVSINYRLGAYGFLALPQLASASRYGTGNYGLLDEIAALRWVDRNIAAFGGNRHDIAIDGQSAGSGAVCDMLASPLAKGLFERGILESGPCNRNPPPTVASAEALGQKFAAAAGCSDAATVVTCLRNAWTPNLVAAEQQYVINAPVAGTPVLPVSPGQAIASGHWNKVPLTIGSVRSEAKLFDIADATMTPAGYTTAIQKEWGANAPAVLAHYPLSRYKAPFYAIAAVDTDSGNACYSWWLASETASQVPTYEEEFDDPTSPTLFGFQPPGIDMSNAHSAELAYLWNFTLGERPLTLAELRLGRQMDRYWGAFAATGNPNVTGQRAWPRVRSGHLVLDLRPTGNTASSTVFPTEHQCAFWATLEHPS